MYWLECLGAIKQGICHRLLVRHLTDLHEMWDMIKLLSTPRFWKSCRIGCGGSNDLSRIRIDPREAELSIVKERSIAQEKHLRS